MYTDNKQLDDITQDSTYRKKVSQINTQQKISGGLEGENKQFSIILLKETRVQLNKSKYFQERKCPWKE